MADEEDIAALVIDNGSGMCKGKFIGSVGHGAGCFAVWGGPMPTLARS